MNERIQKLIEQAENYAAEQNDKFGVSYKKTYNQKFAELIVAECIDKCEFVANMATITNTGEMARKTKATADSCATMIKEHFGVSK